jgi:hypothetical protein
MSNTIIEAFVNEYSDDCIPYYALEKLLDDNYDAVASTSEYNWVQQGKFNVISNEPIDVSNFNYLIQKSGYTTRLKQKSEKKSGSSIRYNYVIA